jgi:hypothetical protein
MRGLSFFGSFWSNLTLPAFEMMTDIHGGAETPDQELQ